MGRRHVNYLNQNRLVFNTEPRDEFTTINYLYVIEGTQVFQYDSSFNQILIGSIELTGELWFAYLPVGTSVYALLTNGVSIYIINETPGMPTTFQNAPIPMPQLIRNMSQLSVVVL